MNWTDSLTYAANTILVLEGYRLAFGMHDRKLNLSLIPVILSREPQLTTVSYPLGEPLLILRTNLEKVNDTLSSVKTREQLHTAMGKLLGYPYSEPDSKYGDRYRITYLLDTEETLSKDYLYSFMVPVNKYNSSIREAIVRDLETYRRVLNNYGIEVKVCCQLLEDDIPVMCDLP